MDLAIRAGLKRGGKEHYQPFVVVSRSRTGSTLIDYSLRLHPEVEMDGEILNRLLGRREEQVLLNYFSNKPSNVKAAGFKIFYYHPLDGSPEFVFSLLHGMKNCKYIHLTRENKLAVHLSRSVVEQTQAWSTKKDTPRVIAPLITVDPEACQEDFERTQVWENKFREAFADREVYHITYEDLVQEPVAALTRIQRFLGVTPLQIAPPTKKQQRGSIASRIANYSELQDHFANTQWANLFK
ncbi:Stf0 family sulfotransferase [Lewinella sp. 4G2]|uniref:Stf0 family sulfotransferase n=1 Tax=Lewinella sp. 4G2 TaxID=1803372 RepID=UPI003519726B